MSQEPKTNESRLKSAGLRMAIKLLPPDLLSKAPKLLESYLMERLSHVEPERNEAGACYMIVPQPDGRLVVMTVTLDEQNTVSRVVDRTDINVIFQSLLNNLKEL